MIPKMIEVTNRHISKQLSFGYDIGKGYVIGEEDISKIIDHISDDKGISKVGGKLHARPYDVIILISASYILDEVLEFILLIVCECYGLYDI